MHSGSNQRKSLFSRCFWERTWFHPARLLENRYEYHLVWSKAGPVRATVVLRVGSITMPHDGKPVFKSAAAIDCDFYRMLYVYPEDDKRGDAKPYYMEELFVLIREHRRSVSFRPYFGSAVVPGSAVTEVKRFEDIPDYLFLWKHWENLGPQYRGYGFASDAHVRGFEVRWESIFWRLPNTHHNRCIHYFLFVHELPLQFDPFHDIGHNAWYEMRRFLNRWRRPLQSKDSPRR
jgi:hypothetical protein